jgi:hypothetical protein
MHDSGKLVVGGLDYLESLQLLIVWLDLILRKAGSERERERDRETSFIVFPSHTQHELGGVESLSSY